MLDLWGARKLLAATSGTLIIVSYVVCIGLAVGTDVYIGGLKFRKYIFNLPFIKSQSPKRTIFPLRNGYSSER